MPNLTLYNCTENAEAPDWSLYDAVEVMPLSDYDGNGQVEPCEDDEYLADIWTVYGHLRTGGAEAITDVSTKKLAYQIADIFEENIRNIANVMGYRFIPLKKIP